MGTTAPVQTPPGSVCPVLATAQVVAGKWTLLMLRDLAEGPRRFSELQRSLRGISPRTLSVRLRALEEEGIIARREFAEMPPRVEYRLRARMARRRRHLRRGVRALPEGGPGLLIA